MASFGGVSGADLSVLVALQCCATHSHPLNAALNHRWLRHLFLPPCWEAGMRPLSSVKFSLPPSLPSLAPAPRCPPPLPPWPPLHLFPAGDPDLQQEPPGIRGEEGEG